MDASKKLISVSFGNTARMQHGPPEATVNELMRGLILTMATDSHGQLLEDYAVIIKNILDVFFHRLLEIADKRFIYQRLQSLELGFGILFGLGPDFYPLRAERRMLAAGCPVHGFGGWLGRLCYVHRYYQLNNSCTTIHDTAITKEP